MQSRYAETYAAWEQDPHGFWADAAGALDWFRPFDTAFDPQLGVYGQWFAGGETNTCHNCIDRHVLAGRGAQAALIYDSPMAGEKRRYSFAEMQREIEAVAAVLIGLGLRLLTMEIRTK